MCVFFFLVCMCMRYELVTHKNHTHRVQCWHFAMNYSTYLFNRINIIHKYVQYIVHWIGVYWTCLHEFVFAMTLKFISSEKKTYLYQHWNFIIFNWVSHKLLILICYFGTTTHKMYKLFSNVDCIQINKQPASQVFTCINITSKLKLWRRWSTLIKIKMMQKIIYLFTSSGE